MGRWSQFVAGVVVGAGALLLAFAIAGRPEDPGLLVLGVCLAGAGLVAGLATGPAMFVGVWLGVPLPILAMAIAAGPGCVDSPFAFFIGSCPGVILLAIAGALLAVGPVVEGAGFAVGRLVRWALAEPAPNVGP